jgi:hypothetical protein
MTRFADNSDDDYDDKRLSFYLHLVCTPIVQTCYIAKRQTLAMWRSKDLKSEFVTSLVMGIIIGTLFYDAGHSPSLVVQSSALAFISAFPTVNAVATVPFYIQQRNLARQEQKSNVFSYGMYVVGSFMGALPIQLFSTLLYGILTYLFVGLRMDSSLYMFRFLAILFLGTMTGTAYTQFCTALCEKQTTAVMMSASGFSIFSLMSGFFIRASDASVVWRWMFYVSPLRSLWEALFINQMVDNISLECPKEARDKLLCFFTDGNVTLEYLEMLTKDIKYALLGLVLNFLVFKSLQIIFVYLYDRNQHMHVAMTASTSSSSSSPVTITQPKGTDKRICETYISNYCCTFAGLLLASTLTSVLIAFYVFLARVSYPCEDYTFASIDGSCHMIKYPNAGRVGHDVIWDLRKSVPVFETYLEKNNDDQNPNITSLPSARLVSNLLFRDNNSRNSNNSNERGVSLFELAFGQFFSHDLSYLPLSQTEYDDVPVPQCDETFDPLCSGEKFLRVPRLVLKNKVTGWFDLSQVYGSDSVRARSLRSLRGGKLIMDKNNYLPTKDDMRPGEDVYMEGDDRPYSSIKMMRAGDERANGNLMLLALHTLFAREHNRLCDELLQTHPEWDSIRDDELLYYHARDATTALFVNRIFYPYVPALLGPNAAWVWQEAYGTSYPSEADDVIDSVIKDFTDKTTTNISSSSSSSTPWSRLFRFHKPIIWQDMDSSIATLAYAIGYRFHAFVPNALLLASGEPGNLTGETIPIRDTVFRPDLLKKYGLETILLAMHSTVAKSPPSYVNDLRNIVYPNRTSSSSSSSLSSNTTATYTSHTLLRAPARPEWIVSNGMDLATIDIMRSRQFKIPTFVNIRKAFGLGPIHTFRDIARHDAERRKHLRRLYGTIDKVEGFVGILMEDAEPGALLPPTYMAAIASSFLGHAFRIDRYYSFVEFDRNRDDPRKNMQGWKRFLNHYAHTNQSSFGQLVLRNTNVSCFYQHSVYTPSAIPDYKGEKLCR